jgi:hypothetical protein
MHKLNLHLPARQALLMLASLVAAQFLLSGCGGPQQAQATAIPASVVRPVQPAPQYPGGSDVFLLPTPGATARFVPTAAAEAAVNVDDEANSQQWAAIKLFIENQTPSAVGIAPGGTAVYAERGGRTLASVPVGGVLTVTGKSADGAWYSVYNEDAVFGWVPAGQLRVYGGDDLIVVEVAPDPAPVATLLAQAAQPVRVLDDLMVQFDATATQMALQPTAAPPAPALAPVGAGTTVVLEVLATPAADNLETATPGGISSTGVVTSEVRLNVRTQPDTAAGIVRKLDPGANVSVIERNADGTWLRIQLDDGSAGWVSAEFISLSR